MILDDIILQNNEEIIHINKKRRIKRRFFDGDGESRTRVRKPIHATFSGCSPSMKFPSQTAGGQAILQGSLLLRDGYKSKLTVHGRHSMMPWPNRGALPRGGTLRSRGTLRTDSRP